MLVHGKVGGVVVVVVVVVAVDVNVDVGVGVGSWALLLEQLLLPRYPAPELRAQDLAGGGQKHCAGRCCLTCAYCTTTTSKGLCAKVRRPKENGCRSLTFQSAQSSMLMFLKRRSP